ncbi:MULTISPECIES: Pr6Pr family membrane protein [Kitasatospora]|uniref:Pr6Pr family membrane protein n=1 Tax=Kitasatospora cathayae TaxID=3004092 RepID=A0ABY7PZP1_9ACTN|nr:Pr6Pr family membrane protein [Kitasatospora sp. HUAS 3-15]WBP85898.1 Pr6Pr family membrane protein [Kitasatospora sp. HUAS 3-15]
MHSWLAPARLAVAAFLAVALCFSGYHAATDGTGVVNFFSYFTNLSNLAGMAVLAYGGWAGLTGRRPVPDAVRGAVVLYLVITGLAYGTLLAKYPALLVIPWVDDVVHRAVPLVVLADWLLDPPARRVRPAAVLGWLAFPLVYLVYALTRGHAVDWYPYPFLDPAGHGGYRRVAGACFLLVVALLLIGAAVAAVGNALAAHRDARQGTVPPRGRHARARTG